MGNYEIPLIVVISLFPKEILVGWVSWSLFMHNLLSRHHASFGFSSTSLFVWWVNTERLAVKDSSVQVINLWVKVVERSNYWSGDIWWLCGEVNQLDKKFTVGGKSWSTTIKWAILLQMPDAVQWNYFSSLDLKTSIIGSFIPSHYTYIQKKPWRLRQWLDLRVFFKKINLRLLGNPQLRADLFNVSRHHCNNKTMTRQKWSMHVWTISSRDNDYDHRVR